MQYAQDLCFFLKKLFTVLVFILLKLINKEQELENEKNRPRYLLV